VMDLLQDMVKSSGSIFVVTHSSQMQGQFSKVIRMVKENGSSTLEA
jgi:ABC-type lipoprotein export system ATPase subunit